MLCGIRRIAEPDEILEVAWDADDGAVVREGVEAVAAVVGAGAGVADAAEGGVGDGGVGHYVVDCYAAGLGICKDLKGGLVGG